MQNNRDVKTLGAETIPFRINLLVRNVLPCYDMLFSCERPLSSKLPTMQAGIRKVPPALMEAIS